MFTKSILCFLIVLFAASGGYAQDRFDSWTTDNGLPQNQINGIIQTRDGYLWLTTFNGLVRYDGVRFKVFNPGNTKGLNTNRLLELIEDPDGSLWITTAQSGVVRYRNGEFKTYTSRDGLPENRVSIRLFKQATVSYPIFYSPKGAVKFFNDKFTPCASGELGPYDGIGYQTGPAAAWYVENNGLHKVENGREVAHLPVSGLGENPPYKIFEDRQGDLWLSMANGELGRLKDGAITACSSEDGQPPHSVFSFCEGRRGEIWFATTRSGLALFKDNRFTFFTTADGLLHNDVWAVYEDRETNLWIGTSGGLNRLRDYIITAYSKADGLSGDNAYPIYQDSKGRVWIGSAPGLTEYSNGIFTRHDELISEKTNNGIMPQPVRSILEDRDGNLWFGLETGIVRAKDGRAVYKNREGPLFDVPVRAIYQDRAGAIWFGTSKSLVMLKGGLYTSYTTEDGLSGNFVSAIYEDRSGTLWIGTQFGLSAMRGESFRNYGEKEGLTGYLVRAIYEDSDGALWIGTYDGGLNRLKDGRITSYTTKEGLYYNGVSQILEDAKGYLWLSCNLGIYRVKKSELNQFAEGKIKSITCVAYGKREGMLNAECNGGSQPAGVRARDGRLWFPTVKGVAVIDPAAVFINEQPPPVAIEEMLVDSEPVPSNGKLTVQPDNESFEIHYTGLSFIMPDQCKFKYKLEGLNSDWIDAGARRTAYFSGVPPGDYVFRVIGANRDGVWNLEGARIPITVIPPLWRTWWAYLLYAAGAVGVGLSGFRYRLNVVEKRHQMENAIEIGKKNIEISKKNEELESKVAELIESRMQADRIFSVLTESLPGTVLDGKYRIDKKIGSGSFGAVYRGVHLTMKHPIAVKVFKPSPGNDSVKSLERFQQEAVSACRIQHPNAVAVLDSGISSEGIAYLVMELLRGRTLAMELSRKGRLSLLRIAQIIIPVCDVLSKAHSMGIVHRDIKSDNIFLHYSREGEAVKVIDFGIAKLMESSGSFEIKNLTASGGILGTPTHMSPERIQNKSYDGKSDVYSLGVVLYEMLCGEAPFDSRSNVWSLIDMHLRKKPRSLREIDPSITEAVEAIILRTLEKDPDKRPSAEEFKHEFLTASGIEPASLTSIGRISEADHSFSESNGEMEEPEQMEKIIYSLFELNPDQLAALSKQPAIGQSAMETLPTSEEEPTRGDNLTQQRWEQIKEIFLFVIELEPQERASFLDRACAADPDLRRRVEALIAADEDIHQHHPSLE